MLERIVAQSEASQGYIMKGEICMSEARKCDRCHKFYEINPLAYNYMSIGKRTIIGTSGKSYDLCPNCVELLDKWLENPDNYDPQDLVKNINDAKYAFPSPLLKETLEECGIKLSGGEVK